VAIASRDCQKGSAVAHRYACAASGYRDLLNDEQVDLIYIPLPNHLHEEWVIKAADHGKHILCEKPLGLSLDSVNRMVDAADRNGVLLYENLMYLQHPQHGRIKEMLAAGRIGTVTGLHCAFTFPGPQPDSFRLDPGSGGGAFHDLNRYPLSAARFFLRGDLGDIVRCSTIRQGELIISMEAEARTTTDERFTFFIAFGKPYRCFYEICGTRGTLRLERAFTPPADHQCRLEIRGTGGDEVMFLPAHDHFLLTIDHVAALIASGTGFVQEHERWRLLAGMADRLLQHAQEGPTCRLR
jgi:predicted dehydrogenase